MKALSIKQPYAWLIAAGHKDIENRSWQPSSALKGQRIVIHASKGVHGMEELAARAIAHRLGIVMDHTQWAYGAAIGTVRVAGFCNGHPSPWFAGPCGIILADAELWPVPVPCKGQLGPWNFPDELLPQGVRR